MSLFFRTTKAETRAITSVPWSYGGERPLSGSLESSLSLIPVYAAVRLIADDFSTLPIGRYLKTTAGGREPLPLPSMLEKPSNVGTVVDWKSRYITSQLLRGNAFGLIVGSDPDNIGLPGMVEWLNPDKVQPHGDRDWLYDGRFLSGDDVLHVPAMVLPGSRLGVSPMTAARMLVESGGDAQSFRRDWYRNHAVPGMLAKNTSRTLDPDVADAAKARLKATMRSGDPLVTGSDWDITMLTLSADDAGFVTSAKLDATQVATIFGIRPEKIGGDAGGSLTYATRDMNALDHVATLNPHLVRFEKAIDKLLPPQEYVKLNVAGLLRADVKTRMAVAQIARTIGLNNIDELRANEDETPLPDGAGQDYTPLGSGSADSPARLIQQMYLGVGKVITADEARLILKTAGVEIDESVTLEELHQSLPPAPTQEDLVAKP